MELKVIPAGPTFVPPTPSKMRVTQTVRRAEPASSGVIPVEVRNPQYSRATEMSYRVDESVDKVIVTVIDRLTGDAVRQIPSEEAVNIMRRIHATLESLFNEVA